MTQCRVFISMPMRGRDTEEVRLEQQKIFEKLKKDAGHTDLKLELIQSVLFQDLSNPVSCLARSINLLSQADIIFFAPGWEDARGCLIEHTIAHEYNLVHVMLDEDWKYLVDLDCPVLQVQNHV